MLLNMIIYVNLFDQVAEGLEDCWADELITAMMF